MEKAAPPKRRRGTTTLLHLALRHFYYAFLYCNWIWFVFSIVTCIECNLLPCLKKKPQPPKRERRRQHHARGENSTTSKKEWGKQHRPKGEMEKSSTTQKGEVEAAPSKAVCFYFIVSIPGTKMANIRYLPRQRRWPPPLFPAAPITETFSWFTNSSRGRKVSFLPKMFCKCKIII